MIGDWLEYDTPVQRVVAFAGKASMPTIQGAPRDPQSDSGTKWAAKLRSSIAGLYVWRVQHASDEAERMRISREADFAFRQAFALCPYAPEAVLRYVNFGMTQRRVSDALLVAETAAHVDPQNEQIRELVEGLQQMQKAR